mmetsp:Transcript_4109/g.9020  ORF Transcript_4109/g.9020 Transcript_4109/m.9020 type:complete len:100 (-) Transcript_4109:1747-2046(-)
MEPGKDWRKSVSDESRRTLRAHISHEFRGIYPKLSPAKVDERSAMLEMSFFQWSFSREDYFNQIRSAVVSLQLEHAAVVEQDDIDAKWLAVEKATLVRT